MTITAVRGGRVGHWSDPAGFTGVTVVLLPEPNLTTGDMRGAAPAVCLRPSRTRYDGDAVFAASCGRLLGDPDVVAEAAFVAVGRAIEAALRAARPVAGIPAMEDGG